MKDLKPVDLPQVFLPCPGRVTEADSSFKLFTVLAKTIKLFNRAGKPVRIKPDNFGGVSIEVLSPNEAPTFFSRHVRFMGYRSGANGELVEKDVTCTTERAKQFLADSDGLELLPKLEGVNGLPILRRGKDGALVVTPAGYDKVSGLYIVKGLTPEPDPSLGHAVQIWLKMFQDFKFQTSGAKSRAAMGLLTHIAKVGGIFPGQAPLLFVEANSPQTGKGYLTKMAAALMGGSMTTITDQGKGVGGLGEAVANALFEGKSLVLLDNCRGKIDSTTLESAMTAEGAFQVRLHQKGYRNISTEKVSFLATSNAAELTPDLAARSSMVQLLHQPEGYKYTNYASGRDVKEEIKATPSYFLRAAFVILKEWWNRGCLSTGETRHEFKEWAGKFDWIGQNICGLAPLMDDHKAAQNRTSNPAETWARLVMHEVAKSNNLETWVRALHIGELCQDAAIDIPGLKDNNDPVAGAKAVGSNMGKLFGKDEGNTVAKIEGGTITRKRVHETRADGGALESWYYRFDPAPSVVAPVVTAPARLIDPAPSMSAPSVSAPVAPRFGDDVLEAMSKDSPLARVPNVSSVAPDPAVVVPLGKSRAIEYPPSNTSKLWQAVYDAAS